MLALMRGDVERESLADRELRFRVSSRSGCCRAPTGRASCWRPRCSSRRASVRESIRRPENNPPLKALMEKGAHPYGMQTFEMAASELLARGIIDEAVAAEAAT